MNFPLSMGFCAQMLLTQPVLVVRILASHERLNNSPWVSGNEDLGKADDLSSLRRSLLNEGDGLGDTPFEIVPCRLSLDGSNLEFLTGSRHCVKSIDRGVLVCDERTSADES